MKILIADDSPLLRSKLRDFLESHEHEIVETDNGLDAVEMYKEETPEVVFMDILMPQLDGLSAMSQILEFDPKAQVIILTSMGQQSQIIEGIQNGAADFIVKPFEPGKVLSSIDKLKY